MKFKVTITIEDTDDGVKAGATYEPPVDPTTFEPTPAFSCAHEAMKSIEVAAKSMGGVEAEDPS